MIFKSKKFLIFFIVIIVLIIGLFGFFSSKNKASKYETVTVEKGDIKQTVDVTGNIESQNTVSLRFALGGLIQNIAVKAGDEVKKGQILANLSLGEYNAAVSQAQANLNQKLAGATDEQIEVAQKRVDSAQVAYGKAQKDYDYANSLTKTNLDARYNYILNVLDDSYVKLYAAYVASDSVQKSKFSSNDQDSIIVRDQQAYGIKAPMDEAKALIDVAKSTKLEADIDKAVTEAITALGSTLNALTNIRQILEKSEYSSATTEKTSLDTQKTNISTAKTTLIGLQGEIIVLKAQNESSVSTAKSALDTAKATLDLEQANYNSLVAAPRNVDIAFYQAVLAQAVANRDKAIIYSPINGMVAEVSKKKGELVTIAEAIIKLTSPNYEINADVPETDVVKIKIDNETDITLDALGSDVVFKGKVLTINPSSTVIQDVVYYKVKIEVESAGDERVKEGMTANMVIKTDARADIIWVPYRTVLTRETGEKYVRVLEGDKVIEKNVELGLKADDGKIEIVSGLNQGETVVLKVLD